MAVLNNSRRRIERANYVPLKRTQATGGQVTRTLEKLAFLNSLAVRKGEIDALFAPQHEGGDVRAPKVIEALDALAGEPGISGRGKAAAILRKVSVDELAEFGHQLARYRRRAPGELNAVLAEITKKAKGAGVANIAARPTHRDLFTANGLVAWARDTNPELARRASVLLDLMGGTTHDPASGDWEQVAPESATACRADSADVLSDAFAEGMKVEPVGRLHLERLDLAPAAIRRGELVFALALAPQEQRRVMHREWSIRAESLSRSSRRRRQRARRSRASTRSRSSPRRPSRSRAGRRRSLSPQATPA